MSASVGRADETAEVLLPDVLKPVSIVATRAARRLLFPYRFPPATEIRAGRTSVAFLSGPLYLLCDPAISRDCPACVDLYQASARFSASACSMP